MTKRLVVMITVLAGTASAQPAPDAPDARQLPGFAGIDRFDAASRAGFELAYLHLGESDADLTLGRLEAHGRYVDPVSGIGGYAQLPFAIASGKTDSVTDVGDLEIGALYVPKLPARVVALVLRAGLTLPTGEKGEAAAVGLLGNLSSQPELYNSLPRGTTLKLGASPLLRSGMLFARFDLGVDWNVDASDADIGKALHWNFGAGVDFGKLATTIELADVTVSDGGSSNESHTFTALALSARANLDAVAPYLAVTIPLDHESSSIIDFAVTAGIDFRL